MKPIFSTILLSGAMMGVVFLAMVPAAHAQMILEVEPVLSSEQDRTFLEPEGPRSEETILVESRGSDLIVEYGSDAQFDLWVSFPIGADDGEGNLTFNPLHTLEVSDLRPMDRAAISVDLTRSPAWSPWRDRYLLRVRGEPESTVLIHTIDVRPGSFPRSLRALVRQFMLDEPAIPSTASFLWGYRVFDTSVSIVMGMLMLMAISFFVRSREQTCVRTLVFVCLLFLLLYDARFSFDLLRTSAADLTQWQGRQFRQLGPIHEVADVLKESRGDVGADMKVAMCFDGADFLLKQLRYLMYPTPVGRAEDIGNEATHLVLIDTNRGVFEDGVISCGGELRRSAALLSELPQQTRVFRFADPGRPERRAPLHMPDMTPLR